MWNGKSWKCFQGHLEPDEVSPQLFNVVLEVSARAIRQESENKGMQLERRKSSHASL